MRLLPIIFFLLAGFDIGLAVGSVLTARHWQAFYDAEKSHG